MQLPECVAANRSIWQADIGAAGVFAPGLTDQDTEHEPMILSLFRKNTATEPVYAVYNSIVAQSRQPHFYAQWQVPDTVTGRFDMICLHLALLFRRLRAESGTQKDFSQAVFDLFFKDMDRSLREMGVGDLGVPKKIQKMGNIFFGLLAALNEAMDRNDSAAAQAVIARNLFEDESGPHIEQLVQYLFAQSRALEAQSAGAITAGDITFEAVA
ncbi:ubiquinol-cytochrome C chaperone family protein [Devosia sp. 2618]|uniref:ubiquinol-cytochrome C chaperone family protein n=1 Tax=Devosia sp. 2618 TaxID=3156454 RepID=UPI003399AC56